ncbi:Legumain [Frankliniella fusca]|uniref:legumain n=1 Tax=Frankliniella fusca TaxID=407009 RepID=A0AAE1HB14_9NEOP|nr:Legumain [Frankliniella fusca]
MGQRHWMLGVLILLSVTATWGRLIQRFPTFPVGGMLPNGGKIWALLVAGSNGYYNYRHQADVCHAYQILHRNGIPDENIIVMMYDDIANSTENPTPNVIINRPNGPNVYKGVQIDYSGEDVNATNFLAVLTGDKNAISGVGSERVIESGPKDHIFINFVDHGAPGFLCFPNDELHAKLLESTLESMAYSNKFSKMVFYVEACESGSMFDAILPDKDNIFVITAADPRESSYACYYDKLRGTYLGDVFSVKWMEDSDKENLLLESLHHQFEVVRTETNTSHVEEYGDLDIGSLPVAYFQGYRQTVSFEEFLEANEIPPIVDAVSSRDVPLEILKRQYESAVDKRTKRILEFKIKRMQKMRRHLDVTVSDIASEIAQGDHERASYLLASKSKLTYPKLDCYETLVHYFSRKCFKLSENPHALSKMQMLINICSVPWASAPSAIKAMDVICIKERHLTGIL